MKIDTGISTPPYATTRGMDNTQQIGSFTGQRAQTFYNRIRRQIWECDAPEDLRNYWGEESLVIDAMYLQFPDYAEQLIDEYDTALAALKNGVASERARNAANAVSAQAGRLQHATSDKKGITMFKIDTDTGGARGPFLNYKQRAGQGMPDGSWYLRSKDGEDWHYTDLTDAFRQGFVFDVFATHDGQLGGSLKIGFIKFNEGAAPERSWWSSPLQKEDRPDESKNAQGGFLWQNNVAVRVAIGGGEDAQLEVSGWGGYKGIMGGIELLNNGFADNIGKSPLVAYTGFRVEGSGSKRLHVPEFKVVKWVDRPDCLKSDAPSIDTGTAEQAAAAQASQDAASTAQAGDMSF